MSDGQASKSSYATFVLAVDDLEWTKHWLGRLRCDQLLVTVARREDVSPKIKIRAVESKTTASVEPVELVPNAEPFAEGIEQVVATLEALWSVLSPGGPDPLVEDLRFSSFVEHLTSVALSQLHPLQASDGEGLYVLKMISEFSLRDLNTESEAVVLDGAVVCTQHRTAVAGAAARHEVAGDSREWPISLVRCGTTQIDGLLGPNVAQLMTRAPEAKEPEEPEPSEEEVPPRVVVPPEEEVKIPASVGAVESEAPQLARDLYLACRQRAFPVEEPDPEKVVLGPALLTVSMALKAGASIKPIESTVEDLAREVGVASVSVENDPDRPFHVRFLVARRHRHFPSLPDVQAPPVEAESQSYLGLYLGQTLAGHDFPSFVSSWPHMLVGGTTGSGKTTFIRSLLRQAGRMNPDLVDVVVVDGKGEIDYFNLLASEYFAPRFPEVVLGHQKVLDVFRWVVEEEIPRRRNVVLERARVTPGERPRAARELFVRSAKENSVDPFPVLIVVVDEFAEIMLAGGTAAQQFEQRVQQVTQVGRSVLVHLILATQRPDASVVRGAIKANLDARVALRLPTHHDSMTVLGGKGAEGLLGRGDLIFQAAGQPAVRLQGYNA
jgi:hypothetical protein